ncbi:uncharacterized protein LOC129649800 isoform X2 [Bubalus kerabau]|uniref:uncharacterized protein LOC129649800 isoform X2 n=1 Tax=Bubalus carabanensis TaxID=3119969 RepID=UPI00244ED654|nr:uncharacterized protein LOC129649800 isoform X2 [Bubalus carabanensis]
MIPVSLHLMEMQTIPSYAWAQRSFVSRFLPGEAHPSLLRFSCISAWIPYSVEDTWRARNRTLKSSCPQLLLLGSPPPNPLEPWEPDLFLTQRPPGSPAIPSLAHPLQKVDDKGIEPLDIHVSILTQTPLPSGLPYNIEQSSIYYTKAENTSQISFFTLRRGHVRTCRKSSRLLAKETAHQKPTLWAPGSQTSASRTIPLINDAIQYNMMPSKPIHVAANGKISFLFMTLLKNRTEQTFFQR